MKSQGQSSVTLKKEAAIQTCLALSLSITKPTRFYVFDLNCGCGENRDNGANCRGTGPLIKRALQKRGIEGRMWLCDIRKKALILAQRNFFNHSYLPFDEDIPMDGIFAEFVRMDNREFVPTIPQKIRETKSDPFRAQGIIVADPDGLKVPLKEIADCLRECPRLDVAIHISNVRRVAAWLNKDDERKVGETVITRCREIFERIPRASWLVSEPFRPNRGAQHYVFYGTALSWFKPIIEMQGRPNMYRLDSPEGRAIVANADRYAEVA